MNENFEKIKGRLGEAEVLAQLAEECAELAQAAPLGKNGTPEDVAQAMVYLAGAGFVTGQNLPVNGGFVL